MWISTTVEEVGSLFFSAGHALQGESSVGRVLAEETSLIA